MISKRLPSSRWRLTEILLDARLVRPTGLGDGCQQGRTLVDAERQLAGRIDLAEEVDSDRGRQGHRDHIVGEDRYVDRRIRLDQQVIQQYGQLIVQAVVRSPQDVDDFAVVLSQAAGIGESIEQIPAPRDLQCAGSAYGPDDRDWPRAVLDDVYGDGGVLQERLFEAGLEHRLGFGRCQAADLDLPDQRQIQRAAVGDPAFEVQAWLLDNLDLHQVLRAQPVGESAVGLCPGRSTPGSGPPQLLRSGATYRPAGPLDLVETRLPG